MVKGKVKRSPRLATWPQGWFRLLVKASRDRKGGGCHHVCQLLQLARLLQLTEVELSQWNPLSPNSVALPVGSEALWGRA